MSGSGSGAPGAESRGRHRKILVLVLVAGLLGAFFLTGLNDYLSLSFLKGVHHDAVVFVRENALVSILGFFLFYIAVTALSLPGAHCRDGGHGRAFSAAGVCVAGGFAIRAGA